MKSACVLLLLLAANSVSNAQVTAVLSARHLTRTTLITGGGHPGSTANTGCNTAGCTAQVPLLPTWNVTCDAIAGQTCTFALHADAGVTVSANANAFYTATAAGAVGPNVNNNMLIFLALPRDGNGAGYGMASFTFVIQVKNSVANEVHKVEFDLGCWDSNSTGGCSVSSFGGALYTEAATLRIDVFTP